MQISSREHPTREEDVALNMNHGRRFSCAEEPPRKQNAKEASKETASRQIETE